MNTDIRKETLCLVGGGSGGDLLPLFVIGNRWCAEKQNRALVCVMTRKKINGTVLSALDMRKIWRMHTSSLASFVHRRWWTIPLWLLHALGVWVYSLFFFTHTVPHKVVTCGGYVAIPVTFAAYIAGIPVEVWELNSVPGRAVRIISWWATKVCVVFEEARTYFKHAVVVEYPLRFDKRPLFSQNQLFFGMYNARYGTNFMPEHRTLLVLGGSQGSRALGKIVKNYIASGNHDNLQIIHQVGTENMAAWKRWYIRHHILAHVIAFSLHLDEMYTLADIVVCRGGAGTLHEVLFFGNPAVVIPLVTSYTAHQRANARAFAVRHPHQYIVCEQQDVVNDSEVFAHAIDRLLSETQQGSTKKSHQHRLPHEALEAASVL